MKKVLNAHLILNIVHHPKTFLVCVPERPVLTQSPQKTSFRYILKKKKKSKI